MIYGTHNHIFMKENMIESAFNQVPYLINKQRSTLNIKLGDLWLKLTNMQPNSCVLFRANQKPPWPLKNNSRIKGEFAFIIY